MLIYNRTERKLVYKLEESELGPFQKHCTLSIRESHQGAAAEDHQ